MPPAMPARKRYKLMLNLIKPKYLIPVHGEFRHLYHHAQIARQMGMSVENILIALNGDIIVLRENEAKIEGKINTGRTIYRRKPDQ